MAKKIFIMEIDDEDIGVKSLYHIFDNTWLYKKIVIHEQKAAQQSVHPTVLCTCTSNYLGWKRGSENNCPVHSSHSG